jgi:hypothetical protein
MTLFIFEKCLEYAEPLLCVIALASLWRIRAIKEYGFLAALLATKTVAIGIGLTILTCATHIFGAHLAYAIYFYFYWSSFAIESILMLAVICSMYRLAMAPLKGLQSLGMLVFTWVGSISVLVALGVSFTPHTTSGHYILTFVSQMQRTQSILILCLLLFVCFAIRPMGLSYRSRVFGVSLGLGIMATNALAQSAWIGHSNSMWGVADIIHDSVSCLTLLIWTPFRPPLRSCAGTRSPRSWATIPATSPSPVCRRRCWRRPRSRSCAARR